MSAAEDRAEIRETLLRYAAAVDRHDWELMASCFTEDTEGDWNGNQLSGVPAIVDYINQAASQYVIHSSAHVFGNIYVELDGDAAEVETYGFGYLVGENPGGDTFMRMRGLRYRDSMVRRHGAWLIHRRTLSADWEKRTPVTIP